MTLLAVLLSASRVGSHCTTAVLIVLGIVTHLGVIGCTNKHVLSPSSLPLTPSPCVCSDPLLKPYAFVMLAKVSFAFGSPKARILQTLQPKA